MKNQRKIHSILKVMLLSFILLTFFSVNSFALNSFVQNISESNNSGIIYSNPRVFNVECCLEIFPDPNMIDSSQDLKLWIPIPHSWDSQREVSIISIEPEPQARYTDPEYGNPMLFWNFGTGPEQTSYKVSIKYRLEHYEIQSNIDPNQIDLYDKTSNDYILYTKNTRTITITDKVKELSEIAVGDEKNPYLQAKQIYEFVRKKMRPQIASIRYGGDSSVRCLLESSQTDQQTGQEYYQGNCHDYSSFFTALCRAAGIPARTVFAFEFRDFWIGSEESEPTVEWAGGTRLSPDGLSTIRIGGFRSHGWAEIYLPNYGWIPVDTQRGTFGNLGNRYVIVSKGRDIKIGPNAPERQNESYGTNAVLIYDGRVDRLDIGIYNIAKIHDAAFKGINYLEPSIHVSSRKGALAEVEDFLKNGIDVNTRDPDGYSPLYYAVVFGHKELVELLIAQGADTKLNNTILHIAAQSGESDIAKLLIANGADVNAKDNFDRAPLHLATQSGELSLVELLISKGADVNARVRGGVSSLDVAVILGHNQVIELLIAKGADVNAKSNSGRTALHAACRRGSKEIIELLISIGADVNVKDSQGNTPLDLADENGHTEIVELLREYGAEE